MAPAPDRTLLDIKPAGTLVILGNGPSLRGFDFERLSGVATLGMNAAYRHWDRIDWRPTHYACLDDALIETHKSEILRLIAEDRISSFFLSGRMLELEPGLANHPKVRFLDEFVPHWLKRRGQNHGLTFIDSDAFRTGQDAFVTTGAYSVRYAAWLGNAVQGEFGYSRHHGQPVASVVGARIGNTALLLGVSLILALGLAVPVGIYAALRPYSPLDYAINMACFAGISVPPFWLALLRAGALARTFAGTLPRDFEGKIRIDLILSRCVS